MEYDTIIVGAGPAGSTAAYTLAKKGKKVALLERGQNPGEKTVFGGTIYSIPTRDLYPYFLEEMTLERAVVKEEFWIMEEESAVKLAFTGLKFKAPPYNKFTIRRSNLDSYLVKKAMHEGASLYTKALVTKILKKGKEVIGVEINGEDRLEAPSVIIGEGVNSFLTRKEGLQRPPLAKDFTLYMKEVIDLGEEKINERFQLKEGEGAIIGIIGYPLDEVMGRAAIWTEKNTLSLIVGSHLDDLLAKEKGLKELLLQLKAHPLVKRLLEGGETLECQGHLIPKGGYQAIPKLFQNGILVTGDAATMVSGRRGTDLAMITGKLAGETMINALVKGDLSEKTLSHYGRKVNQTFFMDDIKGERKKKGFRKEHPDSEQLLSVALNEVVYQFFETGLKSKKEKEAMMLKSLKELQPPIKSLGDMVAMVRYWEAF